MPLDFLNFQSFKDPDARVVFLEDRVIRLLHHSYCPIFEQVNATGLWNELLRKELVLDYQILEPQMGSAEFPVEILPEQLEYQVLPFEWTESMWRDCLNTFLEIKGNVPANCLYLAFPVVGRYEKPYHSIDLISDLLGRGDSSFLFIELVQKLRIFDSISAYMTGSMDPGLLVIQGSVCEGITYEKAMAELYNALDRFLVEGISEKSLQKVKNQAESSLAFGFLPLPLPKRGKPLLERLTPLSAI